VTSEIQQSRYDQLLRRVADLKGSGSKVSEVLTELFPVIDVERLPGELFLLMGTQLGFGAASVTGAAAQRPRTQLFNPVGSGKIAAVSSCVISTTNTQRIRYTTNSIALTTGIGTESFRDGRLPVTNRPSCQIRTDSTVAITDATAQFILSVNVPFELKEENALAVLPPGEGFEIGGDVIASTIVVTFNWRERVAEPSELNF